MLRRAAVDGDALLDAIRAAYNGADPAQTPPDAAIRGCEAVKAPSPVCSSAASKTGNGPPTHRDGDGAGSGEGEMPALEAYLPVLRTIINIAPLLGLLGTIAGMITAFRAGVAGRAVQPDANIGRHLGSLDFHGDRHHPRRGRVLFYNYFSNLTRKIIADIEYYGAELVNFLPSESREDCAKEGDRMAMRKRVQNSPRRPSRRPKSS